MKKYDNDMMNYDENGYYPDEIGKNDKNKSSTTEKVIGFFFMAYFIICIAAMMVLSRHEGNGYKVVRIFVHLFALFGIMGLISDALKKEKLNVPCLVVSICGVLGIVALLAYKDGSENTKNVLFKLGLCLFFMLFISIGIVVIIMDLRGSRGNAERCTVSVTAKCVKVGVSTMTSNGKQKKYYSPTYEYTYEGNTYKNTISNVTESRHKNMYYNIMVDPDAPNIIYEPSVDKNHFIAIMFGLLFVAMPLIAMILVLIFADFS